MLNVESIQNGIVIDHIPAGKGMDIYRLLELESKTVSTSMTLTLHLTPLAISPSSM